MGAAIAQLSSRAALFVSVLRFDVDPVWVVGCLGFLGRVTLGEAAHLGHSCAHLGRVTLGGGGSSFVLDSARPLRDTSHCAPRALLANLENSLVAPWLGTVGHGLGPLGTLQDVSGCDTWLRCSRGFTN